jgi:hypothetical protein
MIATGSEIMGFPGIEVDFPVLELDFYIFSWDCRLMKKLLSAQQELSVLNR